MMDYINKKIKFPAISLSIDDWNSEDINEVLFHNDYCYTNNKENIKKYLLNHKILDSNGEIFVISEIVDMSKWRKYLPFIAKSKIKFKYLKKQMSLDDTKSFYIQKVKSLDERYGSVDNWLQQIKMAKNYYELFICKND